MRIDREFEQLIPPLSTEEYQLLERSIINEGCRDPLVTWNDALLDGFNRYRICEKHNKPFTKREIYLPNRDAAKHWILNNQLGRRNLTTDQRSVLAAKYKAVLSEIYKTDRAVAANLQRHGKVSLLHAVCNKEKNSRLEAVERFGVSRRDLATAERITKDNPRLAEKILAGAVTIAEAKAEQNKRQKEGRLRRNIEISRNNKPLHCEQLASVVLADPPWQYEFTETETRAIENQYPTMTLDSICGLPVADVCTPDAVLFLWATSPKLGEALRVMESWGFTYKTCAVWDKETMGCGYYFRQQHELLLVGMRGQLPVPEPETRVSSVIRAKRGKHSQKPEQVYQIIERFYPRLPKLELFARAPRPGWMLWGNEKGAT